MAAIAAPIAWASHQFTDVPDTSPFHADIAAVRDAGITSGKTCVVPGTPPTFCPQEPISREAMAAFLHRGLSRASGYVSGGELSTTFRSLGLVLVDAGAVEGGSGFVRVAATAFVRQYGAGCPCTVAFYLADGRGNTSYVHYATVGYEDGTFSADTVTLEWVVPLLGNRSGLYGLEGAIVSGSVAPGAIINVLSGLTATYIPFGPNGGNELLLAPARSSRPIATGAKLPLRP